MDITTLESKKISDLRVIAQSVGIDASNMKKNEIISALSSSQETKQTQQEPEQSAQEPKKRGRKPKNQSDVEAELTKSSEAQEDEKANQSEINSQNNQPENQRNIKRKLHLKSNAVHVMSKTINVMSSKEMRAMSKNVLNVKNKQQKRNNLI